MPGHLLLNYHDHASYRRWQSKAYKWHNQLTSSSSTSTVDKVLQGTRLTPCWILVQLLHWTTSQSIVNVFSNIIFFQNIQKFDRDELHLNSGIHVHHHWWIWRMNYPALALCDFITGEGIVANIISFHSSVTSKKDYKVDHSSDREDPFMVTSKPDGKKRNCIPSPNGLLN